MLEYVERLVSLGSNNEIVQVASLIFEVPSNVLGYNWSVWTIQIHTALFILITW